MITGDGQLVTNWITGCDNRFKDCGLDPSSLPIEACSLWYEPEVIPKCQQSDPDSRFSL